MDFSLTADQQSLAELAARIAGDTCTNVHLRAVAATATATDLDLWRRLGDAGLIGIGLPEHAGGGGYGLLETCIVLDQLARVAAPVPAMTVMAMAAPALVEHTDLLDGVTTGEVVVAAAVHEPVGDVWSPTATVDDGRLSGTKVCVAHGELATRFVVTTSGGLFSVEADAPGLTITRQDTTSGVPDAMLVLDEVPARRLGGAEAVAELVRRGIAATCVMTAAMCEVALQLTAEYAVARQQFERPIASFQAVSQRAGDAYIDTEAIRLTAWQAAWRLAEGHPADEALLSAKFWAAEGGWRVMHAAHHVHGGVGVDRDYPLHRYFLAHKQLELQLGSTHPSLARLGQMLADTPVA
jgi:acyl-CoA dehydrogenase